MTCHGIIIIATSLPVICMEDQISSDLPLDFSTRPITVTTMPQYSHVCVCPCCCNDICVRRRRDKHRNVLNTRRIVSNGHSSHIDSVTFPHQGLPTCYLTYHVGLYRHAEEQWKLIMYS